ncbi:c-type cytochrome [Starkeya koreensis]|uniref:C-type cytochrome n=1 Tax=Ancylobacter koreensis TaxID=266121 RepID=A0ABT0DQS8_9HYPH|nr:c-type cytochrome [Ancylobacter koreensis]MCK0209625.1 c-type cytochrome [Ancylobacter koreensis]
MHTVVPAPCDGLLTGYFYLGQTVVRKFLAFGTLGLALAACGGEPEPDRQAVARGEKLAVNCSPCHSLKSRSEGIGPPLLGVIGRKAGGYPGYDYSPALKASGISWAPEQLASFIQNPVGVVPGTKMALSPLSPQEASDIVAYLRSLD